MSDPRSHLLSLIGLHVAKCDTGIYPQKVVGGPNPYEERSEWQNGWNAYGAALTDKWCVISNWLRGLPSDAKEKVEDLLIEGRISLSIEDGRVQPSVNCNDLFYWACADSEDISLEEIPDLLRAIEESPRHGGDLWACRKRKMRPQKPCYKSYSAEEAVLFDAAGPERDEQMVGSGGIEA